MHTKRNRYFAKMEMMDEKERPLHLGLSSAGL
jgi:hypothetical protein